MNTSSNIRQWVIDGNEETKYRKMGDFKTVGKTATLMQLGLDGTLKEEK